MPRSSRMSGRKSAMPPTVSMLKPWQTTTRVTVRPASRLSGAVEESVKEFSGLKRLLLHQRDLLFQFQDPVLPVALGVEPRKRGGEVGIVPAPREPGRVVDEAQRAQRLQQIQLARIEVVKVLVPGEHVAELARHRGAVAREQHPQVLDRRPGAA